MEGACGSLEEKCALLSCHPPSRLRTSTVFGSPECFISFVRSKIERVHTLGCRDKTKASILLKNLVNMLQWWEYTPVILYTLPTPQLVSASIYHGMVAGKGGARGNHNFHVQNPIDSFSTKSPSQSFRSELFTQYLCCDNPLTSSNNGSDQSGVFCIQRLIIAKSMQMYDSLGTHSASYEKLLLLVSSIASEVLLMPCC